MKSFGEELKFLRELNKLSMRELSRRAGVSQAYLSQIENGQRGTPSPNMIKKIAEGLNIEYSQLMELSGYLSDINRLNTESDTIDREADNVEKQSKELEQQLNHFNNLKTQKELISAIETLSDLHKALTAKTDLYYKDRLLTQEEKEKLITIIETILN